MDFCSKIHLFLEFVDRVENWNCCSSLPPSRTPPPPPPPLSLPGYKQAWHTNRVKSVLGTRQDTRPDHLLQLCEHICARLTERTAASVALPVREGWLGWTGSPPTGRRWCQRDNSPSSPPRWPAGKSGQRQIHRPNNETAHRQQMTGLCVCKQQDTLLRKLTGLTRWWDSTENCPQTYKKLSGFSVSVFSF